MLICGRVWLLVGVGLTMIFIFLRLGPIPTWQLPVYFVLGRIGFQYVVEPGRCVLSFAGSLSYLEHPSCKHLGYGDQIVFAPSDGGEQAGVHCDCCFCF